MKKLALKIEHTYCDHVVGTHLIDAASIGQSPITIGSARGSARGAHIRLLGDDVSALHAAFDLRDDQWTLCDLGGEGGTFVAQKAVVELKLDGPTVIHIGQHRLKATPQRLERELFQKDLGAGQGSERHQQVVVLRRGLLHRSQLLKANEAFESGALTSNAAILAAPTGDAWVVTEAGEYTIKQRLATADRLRESLAPDAEAKRSGGVLAALFVMVAVLGMFVLKPSDSSKATAPDNQFTRMIFDGKKIKQKKMVAEKMRQSIQGTPTQSAPKQANSKPAPTAHVVMNLKNAGLGAMIGKVAARAGKTAHLVESAGVAAGSASAGRALSLGGGNELDKLKSGVGTGTTLKVGALGTAGKGGGAAGYKGSGTLSQGMIGNAEVGVLEEETQIDGGLDKEAISRVIRSQLGQIRYCYERQLSASPDLYGKIMIKFTIGTAGAVVAQAIGTTSLNNAMVEGCILRRVAGWQFPTPKGGTNVLVTYPFLFKSTK